MRSSSAFFDLCVFSSQEDLKIGRQMCYNKKNSPFKGNFMKTLRYLFRKIISPACIFFTLIWLVVCVIIDSVSDVINLNLTSSVMCFVIALALAFCGLILDRDKIPFVGRFFLHMGLSILSISVIIALFSSAFPTKYPLTTGSFKLVLLLIIAYLLLATPALLLYHHFVLLPAKRKKSENKPTIGSQKR